MASGYRKPSKEFSSAGFQASPSDRKSGFRAAAGSPKKKSGILSKLLLAALLAGGALYIYDKLNFGDTQPQPQPSGADCNKSIGAFFTEQYRPGYQQNQYPHQRRQLDRDQNSTLAGAIDRFEDVRIEKYDGLLLTRQETPEAKAMHRKLIEAFHAMSDLTAEDAEIYAIKQLQIDLDRIRGRPRGDFSTPEDMLAVQLREAKYRAGSPRTAVRDISTMNAGPPKYRYVRPDVQDKYAQACPSLKGPENN